MSTQMLSIFVLPKFIGSQKNLLISLRMENNDKDIDKTAIKLKVLENRIQKLQSIADEVLNEVNDKYRKELKELYLKKEEADQILKKIQDLIDKTIPDSTNIKKQQPK
jgi:hypothetical protein